MQRENGDICNICFCSLTLLLNGKKNFESNLDKIVRTPCGHDFHLECLQYYVKCSYCKVCHSNISEWIYDMNNNTQQQQHHYNQEDPDVLYKSILACREKNPDTWPYTYRDIVIDRISNARHLFSEIAYTKWCRTGQDGVFVYTVNVYNFISNFVYDRDSGFDRQNIEWISLERMVSEFGNDDNYTVDARALISSIRNHRTDFGVLCIFIDDMDNSIHIGRRLMSTDAAYEQEIVSSYVDTKGARRTDQYICGTTSGRPSLKNILQSLQLCELSYCKCCYFDNNSPNALYDWAKNYTKRLRKIAQRGPKA